ncbi:MAG: glycosyltransferase family 4 protein [Chitinophagales bacterium]|nr:glycosyltransferase family 4 protein [Chitinophagales bacterium]
MEMLLGRKKRRDWCSWFLRTSYISIQIGKRLRKINKWEKFLFTFQTQSIFNGKLEGTPNFIYTDHTNLTNCLYPGIDPRVYLRSKRFIYKVEKEIYKDATIIFTFGSLPAYSLIHQYKVAKEKVIVAYVGSNIPKPESNKSSDQYYSKNILFVGVDWERKGGPLLLKVFRKVLERHKDATLTIIGCTPDIENTPNCKVIGKIAPKDLPAYFKEASLFCMPTLREPFGIVFIEAMEYKLPIISNEIGCLPDMVVDDFNGYLIDDNSIDSYYQKICNLLGNPEKCRQMGENGHNYALSRFTWNHVGDILKENIDNWI